METRGLSQQACPETAKKEIIHSSNLMGGTPSNDLRPGASFRQNRRVDFGTRIYTWGHGYCEKWTMCYASQMTQASATQSGTPRSGGAVMLENGDTLTVA